MVVYERDNQATISATAATAPASNVIPNRYVVLLKPNLSDSEYDEHTNYVHDQCHERFSTGTASIAVSTGEDVTKGVNHRYKIGNLKGYSGYFDEETKAQIEGSWQVLIYFHPSWIYSPNLCRLLISNQTIMCIQHSARPRMPHLGVWRACLVTDPSTQMTQLI
jgi:hypothetical protein